MIKIDLSTKALLMRRELAEKATPGPWRHPGRSLVVSMISEAELLICDARKVADAAQIVANDPPTVIATIDELLRLREENGRLKEELEKALQVNGLHLAEVAKNLFTELAEGVTGDSSCIKAQISATCVHCNASFSSAEEAIAHDKVCPKHPANIKAARLDGEAEWLANKLKQYKGPSITYKGEGMSLREAARKAVENSR